MKEAEEIAKVNQIFDIQKEYATKVAQNLYNYMCSFETVFISRSNLRKPL